MNQYKQSTTIQICNSGIVSPEVVQVQYSRGGSPRVYPNSQLSSKQVLNRELQKISSYSFQNKFKQRFNLEELKNQARSQFEKMSYKDNLLQLQHIIKTVKQLCKVYGFFSITEAMFQFNFDQIFKISVWIHPDSRSAKPLHPIRKQNQFQCQLICVNSLKLTLKDFFPNFDFTKIKTFSNILAYIDALKNDWESRASKSALLKKNSRECLSNVKKEMKAQSLLMISLKTIPTFEANKIQEEEQDNGRKKTVFDSGLKETKSTLIESIRSANSIKQKINDDLNINNDGNRLEKQNQNTEIEEEKQRRTISHAFQSKQLIAALNEKSRPLTLPDEPQLKPQPKNEQQQLKKSSNQKQAIPQNKDRASLSTVNKKVMSMSIQIESQINNLFGMNEEVITNSYYYSKGPEIQGVRNSVLSKVTEEFEDLF